MEPLTDDEDFVQLINIVQRRNRPRVYKPRKDCFAYFNDDEFLERYRLPKDCVRSIINLLAIDISSTTNWNNAVTVEDQVLVTLRYMATGSILQAVGDFHGIHKSTTSKIIKKVIRALARMGQQNIRMPATAAEINSTVQEFYQISMFPCCIGALDCTHIKIQSPGGQNAEVFRNRKDYFSFNCQAICNSRLIICDIVCRWPGSAHDATIFNNSNIRGKLERGEFGENVILGDSGYPIRNYLITPLRNPQTRAERLFNESQIRTRNPIERCFGVLKRRFPILALGIRMNTDIVEAIVVAAAFLHNIAREMNFPEPPVNAEVLQAIEQNEIPNIHVLAALGGPNNARRLTMIRNHFGQL